jgi:hypothetical protein
MTNEDLFAPGVYEKGSQLAHQLIGVSLFAILLVWSAFIVDYIGLRRAYRTAGLLEFGAGLYLFAWVFYFLQPERHAELVAYTTKSLVQIQHVAISLKLVKSG